MWRAALGQPRRGLHWRLLPVVVLQVLKVDFGHFVSVATVSVPHISFVRNVYSIRR